MKGERLNILTGIFIAVISLLVIPFIQHEFSPVNEGKLEGAFVKKERQNITVKNWFSGKYQAAMEEYLNENFGFRNIMVRLNNQTAFSFFNKANADNIVVGKENYLYQRPSINAYYGIDFLGKERIDDRMQQLKFVSDTLSKLNKELILIFGTGKGTFYPDYIPGKFRSKKGETNLECHTKLAKKYGLNYIDFNSYFIHLNKTSLYPLYPKYGIHWSRYGGYLVTDSVVHFIEASRKIDMPDIILDSIEIRQPENEDYDIAGGMNLLFRLKSFDMAYPKFHYEPDSGKTKPSALVIGDSFFWGLSNMEFSKAFSKIDFRFYNNRGTAGALRELTEREKLSMAKEIRNYDVVILIATDWNLPDLGWGFIENTYACFRGLSMSEFDDIVFREKVSSMIDRIKRDKSKMERIKEMARREHISVDSMLTLRAVIRARKSR